ncbi:Uncharacterised protein [Mycobacteroides abscessus subsp. abscessus]|nr:Uncharacterised protein [Mycobacteroides abscessus subsp. abscessus]
MPNCPISSSVAAESDACASLARNSAVPERARVPISSTTSSRDIPMPLSRMVRVRSALSFELGSSVMCRSEVSTSRSLSTSDSSLSLSSASDAFEISSRRKLSLSEYTECTIRSSS